MICLYIKISTFHKDINLSHTQLLFYSPKSTVSRISEGLWEEYEAFQKMDLSSYKIVYLVLDAIYESLRKQFGIKEAVLVAWGILENGRKVLLGI